MGKRADKIDYTTIDYNRLPTAKELATIAALIIESDYSTFGDSVKTLRLCQLKEDIEAYIKADGIDKCYILEWLQHKYGINMEMLSIAMKNATTENRYTGYNSTMDDETSNKVLSFCNQNIFAEPITFDQWQSLLNGTPLEVRVRSNQAIAYLLDALSKRAYICSNFMAVAADRRSFRSSKTAKVMQVQDYKTALNATPSPVIRHTVSTGNKILNAIDILVNAL